MTAGVDRPSYNRALSLIPESASSANEEVRLIVIGQDAWSFARDVVCEASRRFPTLCGGDARNSQHNSDDEDGGLVGKSKSSSSFKGEGEEFKNVRSGGRSGASARTDFVNSKQDSRLSTSSSQKIKIEELPEIDHAPLSCRFWFDGMKDLDPEAYVTEENEPCVIYASGKGETEEYSSGSCGTKEDENNSGKLDGVTAIVPTESKDSSKAGAAYKSQGSDKDKVQPENVRQDSKTKAVEISGKVETRKVSTRRKSQAGKDANKRETSESSSKNRRKKSVMSVVSAVNPFKRRPDDEDSDCDSEMEVQRTVVNCRYFPVESFSEEVPPAKTLKHFKDTVVLFLEDDRDTEVTFEERQSNLRFRKAEVERWTKGAINRHGCQGAPSMLCLLLMHTPEVGRNGSTGSSPGGKIVHSVTQASLAVNVDPKDLDEDNIVPLPGSNGVDLDKRNEAMSSFVEDLRTTIKGDLDETLWYECNFNDSEALLKFVVTTANKVIRRRRFDPNCSCTAAAFAKKLTQEHLRRRRCGRCRQLCTIL